MKFCDVIILFAFVFLGIGIGFAIGATLAENGTTQRWKRAAIEHGAAEYVCDPATGETSFRWKEEK